LSIFKKNIFLNPGFTGRLRQEIRSFKELFVKGPLNIRCKKMRVNIFFKIFYLFLFFIGEVASFYIAIRAIPLLQTTAVSPRTFLNFAFVGC